MKEILAIVRINKMNETKRALSDAGFTGLTATGKVHGRGKGLVDYQLIKGAEEGLPGSGSTAWQKSQADVQEACDACSSR